MRDTIEYTRERVREGKVPISTKILQGFGGIVNSHKDFAFNDGVAIPVLFFIPIFLMSRMTMTRARLAEIQEALAEQRQH